MELKDIVHDIEYGKKLKELGVKQDSIFYFTHISGSEKTWIKDGAGQKLDSINYNGKENIIRLSAFTSTELLEMLPKEINGYGLDYNNWSDGFHLRYTYIMPLCDAVKDKKFCNALARVLIYLIENKLMEV